MYIIIAGFWSRSRRNITCIHDPLVTGRKPTMHMVNHNVQYMYILIHHRRMYSVDT